MDQVPTRTPHGRKGALPWWVTVPVLVVVVAGFGGLVYYAYLPKSGVYVEQVEADARENLKIGVSTREDAMAWFTAHGITDVYDTLDTGGKKNGYSVQIPNDNWMKNTQIQVTYRFNDEGKLREIMVYQERRD